MAGPAWPKRLTGRGWPRLDAAPGYPLALLNPARRVLTRHSGQRNLRGPCFRHRWLPARLEWTEAAIAVGPASECPSLHECDNPTAGLALRLQLPAGSLGAVLGVRGSSGCDYLLYAVVLMGSEAVWKLSATVTTVAPVCFLRPSFAHAISHRWLPPSPRKSLCYLGALMQVLLLSIDSNNFGNLAQCYASLKSRKSDKDCLQIGAGMPENHRSYQEFCHFPAPTDRLRFA